MTGEKIGCNAKQIRVEVINAIANFVLLSLLNEYNSVMDKVLKVVKASLKTVNFKQKIEMIGNEINTLKQRRANIIGVYAQGLIDSEELLEAKRAINKDIEKKETLLKELIYKNKTTNINQRISAIEKRIDDIKTGKLNDNSLELLIENLTVFDNYISVKLNDLPVIYKIAYSTTGRAESFEVSCSYVSVDLLQNHYVEQEGIEKIV